VTVDAHSDDWDSVEASEFALLPALDPEEGAVRLEPFAWNYKRLKNTVN
jgi:hypothetical protein